VHLTKNKRFPITTSIKQSHILHYSEKYRCLYISTVPQKRMEMLLWLFSGLHGPDFSLLCFLFTQLFGPDFT